MCCWIFNWTVLNIYFAFVVCLDIVNNKTLTPFYNSFVLKVLFLNSANLKTSEKKLLLMSYISDRVFEN